MFQKYIFIYIVTVYDHHNYNQRYNLLQRIIKYLVFILKYIYHKKSI